MELHYILVWILVLSLIQTATVGASGAHSLQSACESTRYPQHCVSTLQRHSPVWEASDSDTAEFSRVSMRVGMKEARKVSRLTSRLGRWALKEQQRYALDDCMQLFDVTLGQLSRSFKTVDVANAPSSAMKWAQSMDVQTWLSAAITNQATCLDSLQESQNAFHSVLASPLANFTKSLSNSLAFVKTLKVEKKPTSPPSKIRGRRLLSESAGDVPSWMTSRRLRRLLKTRNDDDGGGHIFASDVVIVSKDGTGNFTTVTEAVNAAPTRSADVHIIYVTAGVYREYVTVPNYKTNIMLVGDGAKRTIITGSHSVGDGWTTFRSATLAAMGQGFMARDMTFENTAGPQKHQAVALRVSSDFSAFYRCTFKGYQDTLYAHSLRQFYRDCNIYGTVDFIFGNAAAVFQGCNIYIRRPINEQTTVVTAQGRDDPNQNTGFSVQKCSVLVSPEIRGILGVPTYMGRPWRRYSRTVFMQSYIDAVVSSEGWLRWSGDAGLSTLYYGEFMNVGRGAATSGRVRWPGWHVMKDTDAVNYTVSNFIAGDDWIQSVPFDLGL